MLPTIDRDFAYHISNDAFGRGGKVDDFRTQQIIVSAKLNDKWSGYLDHSILTLTDDAAAARIDQLSVSFGYSLVESRFESGADKLIVGGGLRSAGEFSGERIQNGFHRLISGSIKTMPYVDTTDTAATVWLDGARYRDIAKLDRWDVGYWLRGTALATSDGEIDSSVSASAVMSRSWTDIWLGVRHDTRSGYDADAVRRQTAAEEDDTAIVFGLRFGALIFETVQQLNNDASYGQLMLMSSGVRGANRYVAAPRFAIDFGFILPDVEAKLAGKMLSNLLVGANSRWRESAFVDFRYGQPQFDSDQARFVDVLQVAAGLEFERPVAEGVNWLSYYGSVGAGWRNERLNIDSNGRGKRSKSAGRAVVTGEAGVRFFAASMGKRWNYRVQIGVAATVPTHNVDVVIDAEQFTLLKPALGVLLGMSFEFH